MKNVCVLQLTRKHVKGHVHDQVFVKGDIFAGFYYLGVMKNQVYDGNNNTRVLK